MITLDIWSDPICPWCYIGKTRLGRALESRPDHPFEIRWHPFQLNPDMPAEGMARQEYLSLKFGAEQGILEAYQPVIEAAEDAGLEFDLPGIARTPNTLEAHRLIHWAGLEGRQGAIVSALFRAYFTEGRDIGSHEVLLELATQAGLGRDMVARLLASDADCELVREADRAARARGIQAVPFFIINQKYAISGAQPTKLWQDVIDDLNRGMPG
ncbi:DsbA family oxidoreductase [Roseinatronobacter bogoriensis]|uniref:DsbA family oxidoreductase n=1 Tax=Roseinatronobacter bogoriensis subsp. barguzinensis TaxID=441209 RepID=A0A2K8KAS8_9RHOB|nr:MULTISPECIES: DsbA family oxidoreductase [Rhodobaca]ATX64795.1 DsbA family oxidoreductase [Rhodobaca barguzinensis]MBB4208580.1 putative DsbA family dithiol-disulfide isomerase [Rhodobaca bogoriensis DSM 18756]TDW38151.1 putative DsbA family dithiol-disulfide isomerase [Rhodobaca barguzinensis]TDY69678.1 putative DsbA family dithiol-disulfide isomerase [Rhodobaca bogoriensis DSM 18756]